MYYAIEPLFFNRIFNILIHGELEVFPGFPHSVTRKADEKIELPYVQETKIRDFASGIFSTPMTIKIFSRICNFYRI